MAWGIFFTVGSGAFAHGDAGRCYSRVAPTQS
jgi:hypothetical protein